ncbi:MAG TPA: alkaline phosphatase D family protein [Thiobacillaceae bacterium]|nr:alkaline phosphatase D family protein [Thiobacillaceae bacterium]
MRRLLLLISMILSGGSASLLSCDTAHAELIVMQGPVTMRTASVWLQADEPGQARIEYRAERQGSQPQQTEPMNLAPKQDYSARLDLTNLSPGQTYLYRVLLDGRPARDGRFTTLPAWRSSRRPFDFTVYFGSCAFLQDSDWDRGPAYGGEYEIFDRIVAQAQGNPQPSLMLWGGDTVYYREADFESPWGMNARQRAVRHHPIVQKLLTALPHYAIWDDHDYGPNDSNRSFVFKDASLALFKRYWANPSYGLPGEPGIFTEFSMADADFFLLDDRWYRDHDRAADFSGKQLYGPEQLGWLKNALLASRARFKLIVGGSQFLNDRSRAEGWQHFPAERDAFLDWLIQNRINGVIFLSGDRHHTELLKVERPGTYPLYELTCSPLTSHPRQAGDEAANPQRLAGTLVEQRNFCTLEFGGERKERSLRLRSYDSAGKKLWEVSMAAEELRSR